MLNLCYCMIIVVWTCYVDVQWTWVVIWLLWSAEDAKKRAWARVCKLQSYLVHEFTTGLWLLCYRLVVRYGSYVHDTWLWLLHCWAGAVVVCHWCMIVGFANCYAWFRWFVFWCMLGIEYGNVCGNGQDCLVYVTMGMSVMS